MRHEAEQLLHHQEEAERQPYLNLKIAQAYLAATDPLLAKRTWSAVMERVEQAGSENTQKRNRWATKCKDFDSIRNKSIIETRPEDFLKVLAGNRNSTNHFLRRYHSEALGLGWLPWPILPHKKWPPIRYSKKRTITLEEHQKIISREGNTERRLFYEFLWETGASQSDAARLTRESINWNEGVLIIHRQKPAHLDPIPPFVTIDPKLKTILEQLPAKEICSLTSKNRLQAS